MLGKSTSKSVIMKIPLMIATDCVDSPVHINGHYTNIEQSHNAHEAVFMLKGWLI